MIFAEVLHESGRILHVGCVMAWGHDWIEISMPPKARLEPLVLLRLHPSSECRQASPRWWAVDRVGLRFVSRSNFDEIGSLARELREHTGASAKARMPGNFRSAASMRRNLTRGNEWRCRPLTMGVRDQFSNAVLITGKEDPLAENGGRPIRQGGKRSGKKGRSLDIDELRSIPLQPSKS